METNWGKSVHFTFDSLLPAVRKRKGWTQGKYESLPLAFACNDVFCPQTTVSVSRCTEFIIPKYSFFKGNNAIIAIDIIGIIYS